jgi:hypothetical protein
VDGAAPPDPPPSARAKKKPATRKAKAHEVTARAAYRIYERENHRPYPTPAEACALLACFFPGRFRCNFTGGCPAQCPKVGGAPFAPRELVVPADAIPAQDDVARLEVAVDVGLEVAVDVGLEVAVDVGLEVAVDDVPAMSPPTALDEDVAGTDYAREAVPDSEADPDTSADNVSGTTDSGPPNMRGGDPLEAAREAVWAEAIEQWTAPAPAPGYPPCIGCGVIRPVMIVMAPHRARGVTKAWTTCSRCYRGESTTGPGST